MLKPQFEELDYRQTPLGELILRRRTILALENREVYEIILGDAFLMSSLYTAVEEALSHLGIGAVLESYSELDVVVGGLGLGYTAREALAHEEVRRLFIVDYLQPVIEWHEKGIVPLGDGLAKDARCSFVHGDFFALALAEEGEPHFDASGVVTKFHAILLDIDHSPENLLHERHGAFYEASGFQRLASKIHPGGVFALWSDDPPDERFMAALRSVFASCQSHVVTFVNPLRDGVSSSTVYVARTHG